MNKLVQIKIKTTTPYKIIKLLSSLNIDLYEISILKDYLYLKVSQEALPRLEKIVKFQITKKYGILYLLQFLKINLFNFYIITLFLIFSILLSQLTAKVFIIHSNQELRNILDKELKDQGLKTLSFKKNYYELQKIKNNILQKYKEQLEWIEIIREGMNYYVKVQDRIITELNPTSKFCHVYATKEGMITRIISSTGQAIKNINNYVRPDEIIISGEISSNEEVKAQVCASGKVYAETWYNISITMPKKQIVKEYTEQVRYNFYLETPKFQQKILRSRLEKFDDQNKLLLKVGDYRFYLQKERAYIIHEVEYTDQEIIDHINQEIKKKLDIKLKDDYQILSQKVLKKSINDSTIYIETFVTVEEQIGVVKEVPKEEKGAE